MKSLAIIGALAAILAALATGASAQDIMDTKCRQFRPPLDLLKRTIERPQQPFCATSFGTFDEFSFQTCRSEMEDYRQKIQDFAECLAYENERAVSEFNDAVQGFNRRTR